MTLFLCFILVIDEEEDDLMSFNCNKGVSFFEFDFEFLFFSFFFSGDWGLFFFVKFFSEYIKKHFYMIIEHLNKIIYHY